MAYSGGAINGGDLTSFSIAPLQGRQTGALVDTGSEIDYNVLGYTPYWNGQQPDWTSSNAWTLQPSGSLTTFQLHDNDVFDDTAGTGAYGTNLTINHGNVKPSSVIFNSTTAAYTISGSNGITGSTYLQINGGALTINNSNGYTSGTILNGGLLNLNNASAIGNSVSMLTISGGTLGNTSGGSIALANTAPNPTQAWNGDFTFNGPYDLNLGPAAVTLSGSRTVTLAGGNLTVGGPIGGVAASLVVTGTGGLVLRGADTYNSGTFILGGNVTATDNNSPLGSGPVTIAPASGSATLNLSGSAVSIGALTMSPASGAAALNVTGASPTAGGLSSSGAGTSAIVLGNAAVPAATTLTVNNGSSSTFGGNISDLSQTNAAAVGNLVVNSTGTTTLSGSNTYTGSTTVGSGVLQLGSSTALYAGPATGNAIINGTLDLNGYNANVGGLSGNGAVMSTVPGVLTLTAGYNNASSTLNGPIAASVQNLVKTGTGTLSLTGANGVSNINISQGTLQIGNGGTTGSLPAAANVVDNGALVYNYGALPTVMTVPPPVTLTGSGALSITTGGAGNTLGLQIAGNMTTGGYQYYNATVATHARGTGILVGPASATPSGTFTLATTAAGSSITLIGDVGQNHATGPTSAQDLILDTSAVNGTINLNISIGYAGDWFSPNSFTANAGTGAINWTGNYGAGENQTTPISLTGAINFSSNFGCYSALPITFNPTAPSVLSGVLSELRPGNAAAGLSVTVGGPSILTVTSSNTYAGSTTISGGTLQLGTGIAGQDGSIGGTSGVDDEAALVYNLAGSQTASYAITGNGSLTKTGTGTVQLTGANGYTGGTIVSNGSLQLGNASALGTGGLAANGGTLDLASFSVTVASFSGASGIVSNSSGGSLAVLAVNQPIATTFGGSINDGAGQVGLVLQGSSTLTLTGTNGYSGGTTVADDTTLIATNPGAFADGSSLTVGDASQFPAPIVPSSVVVGQSAVSAVPEPGTLALFALGLGSADDLSPIARRSFLPERTGASSP